jgi:DNA-binding winged helix-turn-helix (wHTH) protein
VLHYLLAHRHQVVSKQELCEQLWPQQFISDATNKLPRSKLRGIKRKKHCLGATHAAGNRTLQGIESTVRAVRQAAGDSQRTQRCIQTLRGHGYQFVAAVTVLPEPFAEHAAQTVAVAAQPPTVLPPLAPPALGDCPSSALSILEIGVGYCRKFWDTFENTEVSHEQEVHCPTFG